MQLDIKFGSPRRGIVHRSIIVLCGKPS
jgi:hypothetical protein